MLFLYVYDSLGVRGNILEKMFLVLKNNTFTSCTIVRYEIPGTCSTCHFFDNSELNDDLIDDTHSDSFRGKWH